LKARIICNPFAGKYTGGKSLQAAVNVLQSAGWEISVHYTRAAGDATRIASEAVQAGEDAVLVNGGDGTINEAVQALAHSETALGYLPNGTVNLWAREVGIPLSTEQAAQSIVEGRIEQLDLGMAGDRYFLLMVGIGFDAEVVRRAQRVERHKRRLGTIPYIAAGLATAPLYQGGDFELRYDGIIRKVQALMLVFGNTRLYGGKFKMTPRAVLNDGWLDLCIIKGGNFVHLVRQTVPFLLTRSTDHSDVEMLRVKDVTVIANEPLPLHMDGELAGMTPIRLTVAPASLKAIIPKDFKSSLLA
jgi:diacylglycerol kinase (ATP)